MINNVIEEVANIYKLSVTELTLPKTRRNSKERMVCYRVLLNIGYSSPLIGKAFARDHTTVLYGDRVIAKKPQYEKVSIELTEKYIEKIRIKNIRAELVEKAIEIEKNISSRVIELYNKQYSPEKIAEELSIDINSVEDNINHLIALYGLKKVPNYANSTVVEIIACWKVWDKW